MKTLIVGLGLVFATLALTPASAQWGVQTWGYSTVPSWGGPPPPGAYAAPVPQYGGGGCWTIPNPWERERCRRHRAWQRGW